MILAANWKMQMSPVGVKAFAKEFKKAAIPCGIDLLFFPESWGLPLLIQELVGMASVGAQNCHPSAAGAHTGDLSPVHLAQLGCTHVMVGHSERRRDHGEGDAWVGACAKGILASKMTPLICVGETLEERQAGEASGVVSRQIEAVLRAVDDVSKERAMAWAYEPVWAIGTGETPTSPEIQEMHSVIHGLVGSSPVLYGGSVKPSNAHTILALQGVDGALVGGASLKVDSFLAIAANRRKSPTPIP